MLILYTYYNVHCTMPNGQCTMECIVMDYNGVLVIRKTLFNNKLAIKNSLAINTWHGLYIKRIY